GSQTAPHDRARHRPRHARCRPPRSAPAAQRDAARPRVVLPERGAPRAARRAQAGLEARAPAALAAARPADEAAAGAARPAGAGTRADRRRERHAALRQRLAELRFHATGDVLLLVILMLELKD